MTISNLTDITIVLDRSGSMAMCLQPTIDGFNEFLSKTRADVNAANVCVSLVQFDDKYEPVYAGRPVAEAPALTLETFVPRGMTALYDAICKTITDVGARYALLPEALRPAKVLMVIITDGGENNSREFNLEQVKAKLKHQRDKYSWDFVFIGANQDAVLTGAAMGLGYGKTMTYVHTGHGTQSAFSAVSSYSSRTFASASAGVALQNNAFTQEEREEAVKKTSGTGTSA